ISLLSTLLWQSFRNQSDRLFASESDWSSDHGCRAGAKAPQSPEGQRRRRRFSRAGPASVQSSLPAYSTATARCKQFSETRVAENGAHGIVELRVGTIGRFAHGFFVASLDEKRATTSVATASEIELAI